MPVLPTFASPPTPPSGLRRSNNKRSAAVSWCAHLVTMAVLLLVYAAGYSNGRDASLSRAAHHPACHPNLKP